MIFRRDQAALQRSQIMLEQASLAKAVFDNVAESPRELDFRKGDLLHVLDQNPSGLQGWWLCRMDGRQGLAAANRLRLLKTNAASSADYDIPKPSLSEKTHSHGGATSPPNNTYDNPRPWQPDSPPPSSLRSYRLSMVSSVVFRSPASTSGSSSASSRLSFATSDLGASERNSSEPFGEIYDLVLPGAKKAVKNQLKPSPTQSKDGDYDYIDADITTTTTVSGGSHYDCLPKRTVLPRKTAPGKDKKRQSFLRSAPVYDVLPSSRVSVMVDAVVPETGKFEEERRLPIYEPLNITKQTALTRISCMQSQVQTQLSLLFSFVSEQRWREKLCLEEVKKCCEYLVNHLKKLIRFLLQAALASARSASDATLETKLRVLIDAVYVSCKQIRDRLAVLDKSAWAPTPATVQGIEGIVATGQILTEDVRKMTAFVLGNAALIFSEEEEVRLQLRPLPVRPEVNSTSGPTSIVDDEDHEYEDVDYGHVSAPILPRSPTMERKILNSYIQEVNEEVNSIRPLIAGFAKQMFADQTVKSMFAIEKGELIVSKTSKLSRLTESLARNLTLQETVELREKLKKIGSYIATACKRFNSALRAATKAPDDEHFRNVKASLDYLNELCQFLKNSTETEV